MKPMLAAPAEIENVKLPALASPKLDGIRGIIKDGVVLSRSLKPIPNKAIQALYGRKEFNGLDGEFIVGSPTADDVYRKTNSKMMTIEGDTEEAKFFVFDRWDLDKPYIERFETLKFSIPEIEVVENTDLNHFEEIEAVEKVFTEQGYEGMMIRDPYAPYKFGRSTAKQGYLLKLKRFEDAEAIVLGITELMHNDNEATTNELGYTERSSHQENKRPSGMMGTLRVKCLTNGYEFEIGTGFTHSMRQEIFDEQNKFVGKIVKYKYFPVGMKDLPRHPVFIGFRDKIDMS